MSSKYEYNYVPVENDVQDTTTEAWEKLCEYVEIIAEKGLTEFNLGEAIDAKYWSHIHTLPPSIAKLKKVKKLFLYGSNIKRIPPEIGEMDALEEFTPYTSYNLHWFPYEITNCKRLKNSTVSTRALYGNYKYRKPFPDLKDNPVTYDKEIIACSVCSKPIKQSETQQWWISIGIATDVLPLLVNVCSNSCKKALPKPAKGYLQYPHKGGKNLDQPPRDEWYR